MGQVLTLKLYPKFNNLASPAKSEIGILAENIQVTTSNGKIGYEGGLDNASFTWSGNSNYIEVKSNQNCICSVAPVDK